MDKTLQLVVIAAVLLMAAAIISFLVSENATGIGNWTNDSVEGANCDLLKTEFKNKDCPSGTQLAQKVQQCPGSIPTCS